MRYIFDKSSIKAFSNSWLSNRFLQSKKRSLQNIHLHSQATSMKAGRIWAAEITPLWYNPFSLPLQPDPLGIYPKRGDPWRDTEEKNVLRNWFWKNAHRMRMVSYCTKLHFQPRMATNDIVTKSFTRHNGGKRQNYGFNVAH